MKALEITEDLTEVIKMFHTMWDHFPHKVLMVKRDRTIAALNRAGREFGIQLGIKCFERNGYTNICPSCLGNKMLKEGAAQRMVDNYHGKVLDAYWVPIEGREDLYLHFAIDITDFASRELRETPPK